MVFVFETTAPLCSIHAEKLRRPEGGFFGSRSQSGGQRVRWRALQPVGLQFDCELGHQPAAAARSIPLGARLSAEERTRSPRAWRVARSIRARKEFLVGSAHVLENILEHLEPRGCGTLTEITAELSGARSLHTVNAYAVTLAASSLVTVGLRAMPDEILQ